MKGFNKYLNIKDSAISKLVEKCRIIKHTFVFTNIGSSNSSFSSHGYLLVEKYP